MAIVTSQQITRYYNQFKHIEVTFTKGINAAIGLVPTQTYVKCLDEQWPCIIYSSSMEGAKIILNNKLNFMDKLKEAKNLVSLRFCFQEREKHQPLSFFVSAKVAGITPYGKQDASVSFLTLSYTHRPPDDLIEILGTLLEANINAKNRKEERILLNEEMQRRLKLRERNTLVYIQMVPRRCLLRDLSFSGAKVIMMGVAKFLLKKEVRLRLEFEDPQETFEIPGLIIRYEPVEGRKDIGAYGIHFDEDKVPHGYKIRLNEALKYLPRQGTDTPQ
ncbi:type IV pilus assembly PilZ [Spirochaeta thermophila DSM 6578]|uniref:Type IV pilus assembly PilZ n=1 Tax=Winmispira thermophila (strain ATCC 700085 / DSM 6578 / Z-1203) TaxID=869211 RepID=G0GFW1_WINT7|nr:PilZ domain-containing protein [Spirochaeta thermophila]AEJ61654.1 type IV pilus assembly PilZ [Spirochaeta thermophila DSM 6578]